MMQLSHKIQLLMKSHCLSESQLSLKSNIGLSSLQQLLHGNKENLTLRQRVSLAKVFNVEASDLEPLPSPEVEHHADWVLTKEIVREWPDAFLNEFLKNMRTAAIAAHRSLKNLVVEQRHIARHSGMVLDTSTTPNFRMMEKAKVR
jgi:transcriptional regulator with XRE-family HTH domain